jgi:D-glycero-D-manno-heptose 1,7-bisphosphate phosphatase
MQENHFKVIGITNQSSIARGICTIEQVERIHRQIIRILEKKGAVIDRFYYCPYHPEGTLSEFRKVSTGRKPAPGMILQAATDFNIDLSESYMMGDDRIDIETGKNAGCQTVLVLTGKGRMNRQQILAKKNQPQPDIISENILTAIKTIIKI